ncbi:Gfo/Idh/MocA family oxidoreductase [candidate division KSB1 bacterium]|nr:Gfo/Idh/MocA family oxidoreductase [candidate division KSB1 bacterium]
MADEKKVTRRDFMSTSAKTAAGVAAVSTAFSTIPAKVLGANDKIRIAVSGIRSRGGNHIEEWCKIPGVEVVYIVDPDENLFPQRIEQVETLQGKKPKTEVDIRKVLDDKDVDAISTACPDHWHALQGIWACQAGKHVYAEKPLTHNIREGRKFIEAARKYNRIVQCGMQNRSIYGVQKAMEFLHSGELGDVYMAKGLCFKPRDSIGHMVNSPVPAGVHYDLWLGPAPYRPFNPNRFHYNWHWFWDYGCTDLGNQGPHQMDIARWGMNKEVLPKRIKCVGGYFAFDSDQETPNTQLATFEYDDGRIIQFEVRGIYTNDEDGIRIGNLFYGSKGWMHLDGDKWATYMGRKNEPGPKYDGAGSEADPMNLAGAGSSAHFVNFIEALRANDYLKLNADVHEGHLSTSMCHLANIAYRMGRELEFDSHSEKFVNDKQANGYLTRNYRAPYIVPENV